VGVRAFCNTEEHPDWHRAVVELDYRLINRRGSEVVRYGLKPQHIAKAAENRSLDPSVSA
jgi:hypothetical protein